ncbi:MAG: tRNA dihydrouridine synthase DusB [Elusimicrobiota bacterium]
MPIEIGPLSLTSRVVQSPMADCTDLAFRMVARRRGLELAFLEMVSAHSLTHRNAKTLAMMKTAPGDRPLGAQLVGHDPAKMAAAAAIVEEMGFDVLDLNLGCPAPKVVTTGAGASLLREPELAERIFKAVRGALRRIPLTVKTRIGFEDASGSEAEEIARRAEACGVAAVTVHGRTRRQRYAGEVHAGALARVKRAVRIPVLANGGVMKGEDARLLAEATGCDGVVLGRGALGNPWLYRDCEAALAGLPPPPPPSLEDRRAALVEHLENELRFEGERAALLTMRRVCCWYMAGFPGAAAFRASVFVCEDPAALRALIDTFGR